MVTVCWHVKEALAENVCFHASSKGGHVNAVKQPFKARACKTNYYADYPQKKPNKRTRAQTMTQRWLDRDGWIDRQILMRTCWLINCCWQQGKKTLCDYWLKCQSLQPLVSQLLQVTCPGRERPREKEKGNSEIHLPTELANSANRK